MSGRRAVWGSAGFPSCMMKSGFLFFPVRDALNRFHSYINTAGQLLRDYHGEGPFSLFLKAYFRNHKKHGGSDRKLITRLCYGFFRGGFVFDAFPLERQLLAGYYLQAGGPDALLEALCPDWIWQPEFQARISQVSPGMHVGEFYEKLVPFSTHLSTGIHAVSYAQSLLVQPGFFLRIRPGREEQVLRQLTHAGIQYRQLGAGCLALDAAAPAEQVLELDRDVVIQDLNSQHTADVFPDFDPTQEVRVWDCCAASGGKSLLAVDRYPKLRLTVSDIRGSSLHNLSKRLARAGFTRYRKFTADLSIPLSDSNPIMADAGSGYDLVIADLPCSGSGTWGHTPEQRYYFREAKIPEYARRQQQILDQVMPRVRKGGYLLYITCSVFQEENEQQVHYITTRSSLALQRMELLKGFPFGADTLFTSLFKA